MRILACLISLFLAINICAQPQNNPGLTIRSHKTVLVRTGKRLQDFPEKKRATVTLPIFSGLSPSVLKQLRTTLALKNIFGYTLNDYRQDFWLEELSYEVHYNQQGILSIAYSQSGTGAYPDQQTRHFVVDLETGRTIKPSEVFISNQSEKLATLLDSKLQAEIRQILSETGDEGRSVYEGKNLRFEVKDLENFAVGPNGITFLYDAGFPHVIQALEPDGQYLLSFVELKPYLRPEGQLGQFVR